MSTAASSKTLEQIYQKKTQLEHILLRPDSYIGSIQKSTCHQWVLDSSGDKAKIVNKNISYVPGLYKIFDEILVNAADNKQRDKSMTTLKVSINASSNTISVWNNGRGIPVAVHAEHKVYIPEMIFGHLLTSSNYDDDEKKVVGGRNGYGAKLANIFSTDFTIETADSSRKLQYKQTWTKNMNNKTEPAVTPFTGSSDYTCVTFRPDLARFHMAELEEDTVALLRKRVYDMAGVIGKGVAVYLDGEKIPVSSFQDYVGLYPDATVGGDASSGVALSKVNDRWEVGVGVSDGSAMQVSFVNAICTSKGGQHVNYIADQVCAAVVEAVTKKEKGKGVAVKPAHVRNYLSIFVNCLVENPAFDSQTKDTLTTRQKDFGSTAELSESFLKKVLSTGIVDRVMAFARFKATSELQRAGGGRKGGRLLDMPKLDDANLAGTAKGHECTLILTEGDSAKSLAIAGLSVVGRDRYGVFPLRGKLLNVREASHKSIMANAEIQSIVKIVGLQYGKSYDAEALRSLRYGHLMIMSDQDHDGSHIKGLILNFLHHFWPSLLRVPSFLRQFITPIIKASKGKTEHSFFTLPEYQAWKEVQVGAANGAAPAIALRGWNIKYYKGLGTSTAVEARAYFSALARHALDFTMDQPLETGERPDDLIDMAFSKKRADDRKAWLGRFATGTHVDYDTNVMLVSEFINKELILFSMADNVRSIPSLMDGFKPAQRKVLFACFKRNLKADIKVAQLAGYVSEHASYHHGEAALAATITGMAQDYVGANNIPLLMPSGQFGTRLQGGKDAASPRYIFTRLSALARAVFHPDDDALLSYLDDDGQSIEPEYYMPILPMALVNGVEGIGTGWSTSVPAYNPRDLIACIRARIQGDAMPSLTPWHRGFTGTILPKDATNTVFTVTGKVKVEPAGDAHVMTVTELPVGRWTQDYKQYLVQLMTSAAEREKEKEKEKGKAGAAGKTTAAGKAAAAAIAKGKADKGGKGSGKAAASSKATGDEEGGKDGAARTQRAAKAKGKAALKDAVGDDDEDGGADDDDESASDVEEEEDDDDFSMDDDDDSDGRKKKRKKKSKGEAGGARKPKSDAVKEKQLFASLVPTDQPLVKDFAENHTDTTVHFTVRTTPAAAKLMDTAVDADGDCASAHVRKVFKLESTLNTSNMHLFDAQGRIRKYADPYAILEEFFTYRLEAYSKRKAMLIAKLGEETDRLSNRMRFIKAVISGELKLSNRKRADILADLHDGGYKGFEPKDEEAEGAAEADLDPALSVGVSGTNVPLATLARRYGYLLNMPLLSLTLEKVQQLKGELGEKEATLIKLKGTPPTALWLADLEALELALTQYEAEMAGDAAAAAKAAAAGRKAAAAMKGKSASSKGAGAGPGKGAGGGKGKKKAGWDDSDDDDDDDGMDFDDEEEEAEVYKPKPTARRAPAPAAKPVQATLPFASKAPAPAPAAKAVPAPAPSSGFVIGLDDSDDDMGGLGLPLAQRLAAAQKSTAAGEGAGAAPAAPKAAAPAPKPKAATAKRPAQPAKSAPPAKKAAAVVVDEEDESEEKPWDISDDDEEEEESDEDSEDGFVSRKKGKGKKPAARGTGGGGGGGKAAPKSTKAASVPAAASRPGRAAAAKKKSYAESDSEGSDSFVDDDDDDDY